MTAALRPETDSTLFGIAVGDVHDEYERRGVDSWSDRRLTAAAADVLSEPKVAPANSFVLHAPLELLARAGLLPYMRPDARRHARQRIVGLAASFAAAGESLPQPAPVDAGVETTVTDLVGALEAGELDDVDRYSARLGAVASPAELRAALAAPVVSSLAAAAHASIFLYLLPRVAPAGDVPGTMLRGLARELGRFPDWRLRWFEDPDEPTTDTALADALLDVPVLGLPGSDFIFPIMNQAEQSGLAPRLLASVVADAPDVRGRAGELSRVAAWSMLQETPQYAPYGWSHCLTMPQAVMGLAGDAVDSRRGIAVAATHVVGFRSALGGRPLVADYSPARAVHDDAIAALDGDPAVAAAAVWNALSDDLDVVVTELATRAALHHDAHLVKYTLACFDAAGADPQERRLYLAAAAYLSAWWAHQPGDGFFA